MIDSGQEHFTSKWVSLKMGKLHVFFLYVKLNNKVKVVFFCGLNISVQCALMSWVHGTAAHTGCYLSMILSPPASVKHIETIAVWRTMYKGLLLLLLIVHAMFSDKKHLTKCSSDIVALSRNSGRWHFCTGWVQKERFHCCISESVRSENSFNHSIRLV